MIKLQQIVRTILKESGIRGINVLAKNNKEADLYFHQDLDGVTSAIGMKAYLEKYGVKVARAIHIQYGGREYSAPKPKPGRMVVLVDFSHGKPNVTIHTDHHQIQHGVEKDTVGKFKTKPSNIETISQEISPSDIFPTEDIKLISTIDSADFANQNISIDDVINTAFTFDKSKTLLKNKYAMGLVTNLVLLAFKSKPNFMERVVMEAKPSLTSIYTVAMDIARKNGYKPEDLDIPQAFYIRSQRPEVKQRRIKNSSDIKQLKDGEYGMVGNTVVQYGFGDLKGGGYDRYIIFKMNPNAEFVVRATANGTVQAATNPFKKGRSPINLGQMASDILAKYKNYLQKRILTFSELKKAMESDIEKHGTDESFGFTMSDLTSLFGGVAKGVPSGKELDSLKKIAEKQYRYLTDSEKKQLNVISVNGYDFIKRQSGGHRDITNIAGINLLGPEYGDLIKTLLSDFAFALKDAKLE